MTGLRIRLLSALAALAALAGCAAPGDGFDYDSCGVRPRAEIPVEMRGNIPLMQATIKGKPAVFVLDTGSVSVALTDQAVQRFGIQRDPGTVLVGGGVGGQSRSFAGKLEDFRIGDLPVPDHRVSVLPATAGIAASGVDGLFGVSILSVFEIDLDLPRQRVTLYAGRLCADTVAPPWAARALVVDASRSQRGRFLVPVELDGRPLTALIDTGAAVSVVADDVAASLGVTPEMLARDPKTRLAGTGPEMVTAAFHRFRSITFAGQTFAAPILVVSRRADPAVDLIIGADYLAHRHLWLSYARRRVFIERPGP